MKVMRWGDNMRNVAVTEGDKTEAERVFGASINTWPSTNSSLPTTRSRTISQGPHRDYKAKYDVAPELLDSRYDELFIAAKEECAMVNMMRENGCTAGVTTRRPWCPAAAAGCRPAAIPVRVRLGLLRRRRLEDRRAGAHRRRDGLRP